MKTILSTLRGQAEDPLTGLCGAFGSCLAGNKLTLNNVGRAVLTGAGLCSPERKAAG